MPRTLILILVVVLAAMFIACGDIDIANEGMDDGIGYDLETPEGARLMLSDLEVPYTIDEFVERARQSDAVAVYLFLMAGMNPEAKDKNGDTALKVAEKAGHEHVVKLFKEFEEKKQQE